MARVKTGIYGLDELVEGGFPSGRTILITGEAGTGKTIFAMQYAYRGAMEYGEPAVYVTLDERPVMLRQDMKRFGFDIDKAEKKGVFALIDASSAKAGYQSDEKYHLPAMGVDVDRLLLRIMQVIDQIGAKRVVIDSLAGLGFHLNNQNEVRRAILKMNYMLMKNGATTIITSEVDSSGPNKYSKYGVEEYVADGVIILSYLGNSGAGANRTLFIKKLRGTSHSENILPIEFTRKGFVVEKPEDIL